MYNNPYMPNTYLNNQQPFNSLVNNQPQTFQNSSLNPQMASPVTIKLIDSENDIRAGDVPMDGTYAVFLMRDHSAIYIRTWSNRGCIEGQKFVPVPQDQNLSVSKEKTFTTLEETKANPISSEDISKLCDNISFWSQQQAATTESISKLCDTLAEAQGKAFNHPNNKPRYNKGE